MSVGSSGVFSGGDESSDPRPTRRVHRGLRWAPFSLLLDPVSSMNLLAASPRIFPLAGFRKPEHLLARAVDEGENWPCYHIIVAIHFPRIDTITHNLLAERLWKSKDSIKTVTEASDVTTSKGMREHI